MSSGGTWTCRCSARNEEGWRYCEGCGLENPKAARVHGSRDAVPIAQAKEPGPPPCTLEQNRQANAIFQDVLAHRITREEGVKRMAELFGEEEIVTDAQTSAASGAPGEVAS